MSKNVLIVSGSMRKGSNSDMLAKEFGKGAAESGNNVQIINLADKKFEFCKDCLACIRSNKCIISDDMGEMLPVLQQADAVIFAGGVTQPGDIKGHEELQKAYELGKSIK